MRIEEYLNRAAGRVAHRIRSIVVERTVPVRTGELRRSITTVRLKPLNWVVGTNKVYARAVHDGRPRVVIKPRKKKALYWKGAKHPVKRVVQPPRKGKPFMRQAVDMFIDTMEQEVRDLLRDFPDQVAGEILRGLKVGRL